QAHDAHDQRRAESNYQDRADIDRQEVEAGLGCEPHRPEERPRGAVDGERKRIDEAPGTTLAAESPRPIAVAGDDEQKTNVAEREGDNDPALQHSPYPYGEVSSF